MKKNDVFTFTAPNGVEVTAVVVHVYETRNQWYGIKQSDYLCYAQNRLFLGNYYDENGTFCNKFTQHGIVVDYVIIPYYDDMLKRYKEVECNMEHSREAIRTFIAWGFSEEEAINILDGKNPDGTKFIELPF